MRKVLFLVLALFTFLFTGVAGAEEHPPPNSAFTVTK
ncbi:exported hypothetical protein [[Clostridium] ultunense Esp]|nr:exported hypothetical protein [[Clostridium] ultunense Esp]